MRNRRTITLSILVAASLAASLAMLGCSANDPGGATTGHLSLARLLAPGQTLTAPPDSMPGHHPPPPSPGPKQVLSLQFAGADSASAGHSANTRWQFGNSGHAALSVSWVLTNGHGWPGFPLQGTLDLAPQSSQVLTVAVAVPDTAQTPFCPLQMTATPPHGAAVSADGFVVVQNGSIPPDSTVIHLR
jgi:hypothetical protein